MIWHTHKQKLYWFHNFYSDLCTPNSALSVLQTQAGIHLFSVQHTKRNYTCSFIKLTLLYSQWFPPFCSSEYKMTNNDVVSRRIINPKGLPLTWIGNSPFEVPSTLGSPSETSEHPCLHSLLKIDSWMHLKPQAVDNFPGEKKSSKFLYIYLKGDNFTTKRFNIAV